MPQDDFVTETKELRDIARDHGEKIAAVVESTKAAHKRIAEMGELSTSVNNLAQATALVAEKVELITERLDKSIDRIERGQQAQGERIGGLEKAVMSIAHSERVLNDHDKRIGELDDRVNAIEKAPADKWNKFTWLVFTGIITAVVAFCVGRFL